MKPFWKKDEPHWLETILWKNEVWNAPDGKQVPFQQAEITHLMPDMRGDPYRIMLARWKKSYSIIAFNGDEMVFGFKQLPREDFEQQPDRYLRAAETGFLARLPHSAANYNALDRLLRNVADKHDIPVDRYGEPIDEERDW